MKNNKKNIKLNKKMKILGILAVAVPATVFAANGENYVEIGGADVTKTSAKFGEYNGLDKKGATVEGNFEVQGGNSFDGGDGTSRWTFKGSDLGTTSRSINASLANQGKWKLNIGYDQLRHNVSDTYQTPLVGTMGGNNFTLPSTFGTINMTVTVSNPPGTQTLNTPYQLGAFHTEKVGTTRHNTSLNSGYTFNDNLNLEFGFNHLEQTGAKLMAASSQGGAGAPTPGTADTWYKEAVSIIMNPTKYKTDTFDLALNWNSDKAFMTASYFGSFFRDGFNSVSWQNSMITGTLGACAVGTNCTYEINSMSTAPNNDYHQLTLDGGYNFSTATKVVGSLSYGRNTQNDGYAQADVLQPDGTVIKMMQTGGLPAASLKAVLETKHADLKLTNQAKDDLFLTAGFKYNERNNDSPSKAYNYFVLGGNAAGQQYTGINNPYSNSKLETTLAADYRLTQAQKLRFVYETENVKRWCNNAAHGYECVESPESNENKFGLNYKIKALEDLNLKLGYTYATKNSEHTLHFMTPIGSKTSAQSAGLDGRDFLGYVSLPYASRKEHLISTGATWQATETLDVGLSGSYTKDNYDSILGVRNANNQSVNLDTSYSYNENHTISLYGSLLSGHRDLVNGYSASATPATTTPTLFWTNRLKDDSTVIGLTSEHRGLLGGKMSIVGDFSYSLDKSKYSSQVLYASGNCTSTSVLTCGDLPDIKSKLITFKLTDHFQINKSNKVSIGYVYEKRNTEDFFYNGYQYGYTPMRVMPTNEQAPTYTAQLVTVSYSYLF
jgi:MtrB/PioB family decaheme-associated outer membrane protein